MASLCEKIESRVLDDDLTGTQETLSELEEEFSRVKVALAGELRLAF